MAAANYNDVVTLGMPDHCYLDHWEKGPEYKRDGATHELLLSVILAIGEYITAPKNIQ